MNVKREEMRMKEEQKNQFKKKNERKNINWKVRRILDVNSVI